MAEKKTKNKQTKINQTNKNKNT